MTARIQTIAEKKFVGMRMVMSLAADRTGELWRNFMPRLREIVHTNGSEVYSLQVYPASYFDDFSPDREFTKWALVEVNDFYSIPAGMESFTVPAGLYAVFVHKGPSSQGAYTFQYIFGTWLPQSQYVLDDRPHFEVLGSKYKHDDPDAEEEIWVPVRAR